MGQVQGLQPARSSLVYNRDPGRRGATEHLCHGRQGSRWLRWAGWGSMWVSTTEAVFSGLTYAWFPVLGL